MSSAMMMERTGMAMPGMNVPGMGASPAGMPAGMPAVGGFMMVPRGHLKFEKCTGGMKISCSCDDKMACSMVQNLCTMLAGGMCSCCAVLNGMTVCYCNLTMGLCKCEMTEGGMTLTCTSGDPDCGKMIQACCETLSTLLEGGCTCCVLMNNTPVCCGSAEAKTGGKKGR